MSLSFNGRVLFIKGWYQGQTLLLILLGQEFEDSKFCYNSVIDTTVKKETKVEFPEARIYEERAEYFAE